MSFLLDCMLGKLARWLRILGYDAAYFTEIDDDDLLRVAREEGRILLTRDRPLCSRADVPCLLVEHGSLDAQLAQLVAELDVDLDRETFTRCLECNIPILSVSPESVRGAVPDYVFNSHVRFHRCPSCERIYWPGTHYGRMESRLATLRTAVATHLSS